MRFKKGAREEACQATPFDVAKSEEFNTMFDLAFVVLPLDVNLLGQCGKSYTFTST